MICGHVRLQVAKCMKSIAPDARMPGKFSMPHAEPLSAACDDPGIIAHMHTAVLLHPLPLQHTHVQVHSRTPSPALAALCRHHRYIFEEKDQKERGKKEKSKVVKARLQELGPRFTLRLCSLQKGTFDSKQGEFEWVHKPDMDTSRRKFHL